MTHAADSHLHQDFEVQWWGDCLNTFSEENKQLLYARDMNLVQTSLGEKWPVYDLGSKNIIDVGGGPSSLLLKCVNRGAQCLVVDPGDYPEWTRTRYLFGNIHVAKVRAEEFEPNWVYDEVWMYNVLQHTVDPEQIIMRAKTWAKTIRIAEWVDTPPSLGHPHGFTKEWFDTRLGGEGTVTSYSGENGLYGNLYHGVFSS